MPTNARCMLPLFAALLLSQPAAAQKPFEGSVTYDMKGREGKAITMVHHVKGDDIRIDMNMDEQSVSILTDRHAARQIFLMHRNKQWMDAKAMQERMARMLPGMAGEGAKHKEFKPAELNIRATGEKETIAGHECEHYVFTAEKSEVHVCAAKGLGWYFGGPAGGGMMGGGGPGMRPGGPTRSEGIPGLSNAQREQWEKLFAEGFFPLKISVSGPTPVSMVVTDISRKALEPALFRPPESYSEMRVGGD